MAEIVAVVIVLVIVSQIEILVSVMGIWVAANGQGATLIS